MKAIRSIFIKLAMIVGCLVSFFLLLTSTVSLKIDNTQSMGKEVINRVVQNSGNQDLKMGVELLEQSGLEYTLLKQLPKKYKLELSYADLYRLCEKYNQKGQITVKDLKLSSKTKLEEIINAYLVKQINYNLKKDAENVSHMITIYEYSIFVVALLFLLAIVLVIFGRSSASLPLIIAAVASFAVLWLFSSETTTALQERVYSGITVELSQGVWWGVAIGIITAIIWPILLKIVKGTKK